MHKKNLITLFLAAISLASCKKTQQKSACGTQACTLNFASVGVQFTDKNDERIVISNFTAVDLRTNKAFVHVGGGPTANTLAGYEVVVNDSDLKDLSSEGDNIRVSATKPATGETKTALLKIAGECNCHVTKISGPDTIKFD